MKPHAKSRRRRLIIIESGLSEALSIAIAVLVAFLGVSCAAPAPPGPSGSAADQPTDAPAIAGVRATAVPTAAPTAAPAVDFNRVKPNELGTVPILESHLIVNAEEDQWAITPDHFRRTLQDLYDAGYRPVSMADLVDRHIDLPAGMSPIVLTFDDSSPGQFTFIEKGDEVVVDPNCAVGILEAFHASHPDWALRGVFFVLPEAAQPHKLFGQPKYEIQKLRYLVDRGFEIGNHTYWHQRLDVVDATEVQRQIALPFSIIARDVPGYKLRFFSLPEGMWPEDRSLAVDGSYQGFTYHNDAVLLVGSDPAPSPYDRDFDTTALPRVQIFEDNAERWISYLAENPDEHYVSDGDPDVVAFPKHLESHLNQAALNGRRVVTY